MTTRMPAVAGLFYPADRQSLEARLAGMFSRIKPRHDCKAVISPHAGYEYSGKTAAQAISSLKPAKRFIIIGNNHYLWGADFAAAGSGAWDTPLGEVPVDQELASSLLRTNLVEESGLAHEKEHSIEVQLPLLKHRFGSISFVPVSIMCIDYSAAFLERCVSLGKAIARLVKDKPIGVVASSDFSHHIPLESAEEKDRAALEPILKLDASGFFSALKKTDASVCGYGPIAALIGMARELGLKPRMLHSSTSADAGGPKNSVVGYHAVGFS